MSHIKETRAYILSCIDGASFSEAVCDYSSWIARKIDAPLKLLHTIEHPDVPAVSDLSGAIGLGASEDLLNELTEVEKNRTRLLIKQGNLMLQAAKERALQANVREVELRQKHGSLTEALVDMEEQIRVLVMGIRGESHMHENDGLGNQLESIIRSLHKPILVVNKSFIVPSKIMLAYNGSSASQKALEMVAMSSLFKESRCHVVHVADSSGDADTLLDQARLRLVEAGVDTKTVKLRGKLEEVLPAYQVEENMDMTVMGAFSHNRVRDFLLGSFTAHMLEKTQKPLLLLR